MISVKNLTRKYGPVTAVSKVTFDIPRGQIVGLLGHNGAGKTTTLKMLTGYLEPTEGEIWIGGNNVASDPKRVQEKLGYLSEQSPLYPEMTIYDYLHYVADLRAIPQDQREAAIKNTMEATELMDRADQLIGTLSKGYRQRVGVAQAILHNPEVVIFDEPTNGLDPTQILAMRKLLQSLAKKATVLLSTHILQEVEAICDRVIIILQGQVAVDAMLSDLQKGEGLHIGLEENLSLEEARQILGEKLQEKSREAKGVVHFYLPEGMNQAPKIAQICVEKGWKLFHLYGEQKNLEAIFKDVNRGVKGANHVS